MTLEDVSVLIVEDNLVNQRVLSAMVKGIGVSRVEIAANGREGLDAVRRAKPDLILLDVMMPTMDGYEMCRKLREDHPRDDLPVLFVTALNTPESRAACFAAGGTDMVSKPLNMDELRARLRVHLDNRLMLRGLKDYRERMREELDLARSTQEALHPDRRQLDGLERRTGLRVVGAVKSSSELGGDFWTVYEPHYGTLGLLIADFVGHGVAAALNAVRLHALMSRRPSALSGPGELLEFLNHELKRLLQPGQFASALACEVDPDTGVLTMAGAMTPPPIIIGDGDARVVEVAGPPLGAFMEASYDETTITLPRGGALMLYSDALLESAAGDRPAITLEEVLEWCRAITPGGDLVAGLLERFEQRVPGPPPDDLTLVSLYRQEN